MNKKPTLPGNPGPLMGKTNEERPTFYLATGVEIGREQILGKYWELANVAHQDTKGSLAGQLKALDSLCDELAPAQQNPAKRTRTEIYRSAWMDED
jgi:hypothetical protein